MLLQFGLALLLIAHAVDQPLTAPQQTGLILGRVVDAVSGQPVASAQVRAGTEGGQPLMTALTGADGYFVFSHLEAGAFSITATRPGYLDGAYGRRRPTGSSLPLRLGAGERRGNLTIEVWPEASISGRILDDQHRPLSGATVSVLDGRFGTPGPLADAVQAVTNADGTYRIDGLRPGRYLVAVLCHSTSTPVGQASDPVAPGAVQFPTTLGDPVITVSTTGARFTVFHGPVRDGEPEQSRSTFVTTWFDEGPPDSDVTGLDLRAGEDRTGVDIAMRVAPATAVGGRVTGAGGRHALVRLFPPDQDLTNLGPGAVAIAEALSTPEGRFEMPSVPTGPYLLYAYGLREAPAVSVSSTGVPRSHDAPRPDDEGTWAMRFIDVGEATNAPLTVALRPGITVSGTLELAVSAPASMSRPLVELGSHSIAATPGAQFTIPNVRPGSGQITVSRLPQGPMPWVVVSVTLGGRDVTGLPYRLGDDDVAVLIVTIGPGATITGDIRDDDQPSDDAATVVLFPADSHLWWSMSEEAERRRIVRAAATGFVFDAVPPGDYLLAAVDDATLADWPAPALLERLAGVATPLTVEPGQMYSPTLSILRDVQMTRTLWLVALLAAFPTPSQTATVTGRIYDDAGRAVQGARVSAVSRTAGVARSTRTGADGAFSLAALPNGTYTLAAERPGYETRQYGQTALGGPGTPISLSDGSRQDAIIVLNRHGSIAGRVVDEHGRPVRSRVIALRWAERNGIRAQVPMATSTSDRHGRYTLAALPPGEYIVAAISGSEDLQVMTPSLVQQAVEAINQPSSPLPIARGEPGPAAYVASYYPGVPSSAAATPIDVGPGAARSGIDLRLLLMPTARVEGTVVNADGSPAARTIVVVASLGTNAPTGHVGHTSEDGRFSIATVPHGTYLLLARTASMTLQVGGALVRDVRLRLPATVPVAGRLEFIGDSPRSDLGRLAGWRVVLMPAPASIIANMPPAAAVFPVREDGKFEGRVAPGIYLATVSEARPTGTWTVESAVSDGRDLLDEPVTVTSERPPTNVTITVVDQPTEITGVLRHPDGTPEPGVMMVAFSRDPRFWTNGSRRVASARPDPAGRYRIAGLPPGEYLIGAVGEFNTTNGIAADILESLAGAGTAVSLVRGGRIEQDFVVGGSH